MKIISHRGNLEGAEPLVENSPAQIEKVIAQGYDVEIDVWFDRGNNSWWLGHDYPKYSIDFEFLDKHRDSLWCHCKDVVTFRKLIFQSGNNAFMHDKDLVARTERGYLWTYNNGELVEISIAVMPEHACNNWSIDAIRNSAGVCTDYPVHYSELLLSN